MSNTENKPKYMDGDFNFWQGQNSAWLKSDLPQEKFCKLNNISYPKFLVFRSKLKASEQTSKLSKLVPLQVTKLSELSSTSIKLRLPNGVALEFASSTATPQLQSLFKLLGIIE